MADDIKIRIGLTGRVAETYRKVAKSINTSNNRIRGSFKNVGLAVKNTYSKIMSQVTLVRTAFIGIAAIIAGRFGRAIIKAGSEVEDLTVQFKVLLGSVEAARERMEELEKFSQTTPFQLEEVARASRVLEVLTKGALSTGDSLRLVGDAAAVSGMRFDELAMWVGRAYDGLKSNRPIGEALMRLQELGLVTGDTRAKIESLQQQARGSEAWKVMENQLLRNKGGMEELSKTVTGLTSTLKDQLNAAIRQTLSAGLWDDYKSGVEGLVDAMNKALEKGTFTKWGQRIRFLIAIVQDMFNTISGAFKGVAGVIDLVMGTIDLHIARTVQKLIKYMESLPDVVIPDSWITNLKKVEKEFKILGQAGIDAGRELFEEGLGNFEKTGKAIEAWKAIGTQAEKTAEKIKEIGSAGTKSIVTPGVSADSGTPSEKTVETEPEWLQEAREHMAFTANLDNQLAEIAEKEMERRKKQQEETNKLIELNKRLEEQRRIGSQQTTSFILGNLEQTVAGYKSLGGMHKAIAVTQALHNTYASAVAAYKSTAEIPIIGPGLAPVAAASAIAAGMANVAKIQSAAEGGILQGPKSGYPAVLHGQEAVIPLKHGAVPVRLEGQQMGQQTVINNYYYQNGGQGGAPMTEAERLLKLSHDNREISVYGIA